MFKKYFILLCLLPVGAVSAQSSQVLEAYMQEGLQNNLSLRQETLEIAKATENIRQAKALFYPRVTFAPTYSLAAGGRRLQFPVGDLLNPVYATLNALTDSRNFPQIENVDEQLAPNNFHDTKVSVQYSIYNPEIQYNYLIQQNLLSAQEARRKVVENELRHAIETAYYQYLQTLDALRIFENSRMVLLELVRLNQKLVSNQVQTKEVVFAAEYELSKLEQQRAEARKNHEVAKAYFNFLLNRDLRVDIQVDEALNQQVLQTVETLQTLSEGAVTRRQELKQLGSSIEAAQNAVRLNENAAVRPTVFVGGNAGFQGFGYEFKGQGYALGQVGLQWDLFKGYERKSKIQQARIQTDLLRTRQQEVARQIEMQVTQAYYDLQTTHESLRAATSARHSAEQYFRVIDSRYRNGNVLLIEYVKVQNDVLTAQLQQSLSRYDLLIKKAMLDKVTAVP
ncbi:TolC family protein [Telluribacter sp.]|jgi:outer membrane protein TolC|uniref:TolC family protein n=1 Tax=Telluribacter sp. TaxID=1978767 RepID=UPI002E0F1BF3|nr:TolC family protein [Telluribacter sp.]